MRYIFTCRPCALDVEVSAREPVPVCKLHGRMVRNYRAEGVMPGKGVYASREMDHWEATRLFLPTTDDFKGPDDPDGTKGLRKWREEHGPRHSKAVHPEERMLRKSF